MAYVTQLTHVSGAAFGQHYTRLATRANLYGHIVRHYKAKRVPRNAVYIYTSGQYAVFACSKNRAVYITQHGKLWQTLLFR